MKTGRGKHRVDAMPGAMKFVVTLPPVMATHIEKRVEEDGFISVLEYVRGLIREDMKRCDST